MTFPKVTLKINVGARFRMQIPDPSYGFFLLYCCGRIEQLMTQWVLESDQLGCGPQLCHLLTEWFWPIYVMILNLIFFPICKNGTLKIAN